ncbi:CU044_5270 family protein, partial [Kitasatospora sp. NPDC127060]|uniref:CU044_5270 family protein n=1 Tax=Kitasatospora sp. NPDC127060 TaxID=3347121 RepID=UPI00365DE517
PAPCPAGAAAPSASASPTAATAATASADPTERPTTKDPLQELAEAATAAAARPAPDVRDGQFVHTRTVERIDGGSACVRKVWSSADGRSEGLIVDPWHGTMKLSGNRQNVPPSLAEPTYRYLAALPTDPDKLLPLLRAGAGSSSKDQDLDPDLVAFREAESLLTTQLMPPAVGAAFCRTVATLPGVSVVPDAVDLLGRHGIGVTGEDGTDRVQLIFDRNTCELLGDKRVRLVDTSAQGGLRAGAASEEAIVLRAVTDRAGQETEG